MVAGDVFVSYRGDDSGMAAALLYGELTRRLGVDRVFLDCRSIPPGADYVQWLVCQVRSARVVLAVIGPDWLTLTTPTGRRRIDDPADWIHRELAEAFAARVTVIPVLTDDAVLPLESELPTALGPLSRCQYRRLRRCEIPTDLDRIVTGLAVVDPTLVPAPGPDHPPAPALGAGRTSGAVGAVDMRARATGRARIYQAGRDMSVGGAE